MAIQISAVVPTKGRDDLLARLLQSLADQSLPTSDYEVIVVDDGPSAATRQAVDRIAEVSRAPIRYIPNLGRKHGPAAARNLGWRHAAGAVIAFTDDDTIADRRWLENGLRAFGDPAVDGAMGRIVVPLPWRPTDHERDTAGLEQAEFATANVFYRRRALEQVGGFDERFTTAWREDADLYFTLLERGSRLERLPWALVVHPARRARWGSSIKAQRKTQFNALLRKKHPVLYAEHIGSSPRWYWAAVGAAVAAVWAAVTGRRRTAAIATGAWIGMTAAFTASRLFGASKKPSHVAEMVVTSAAIPPLSVFRRVAGSVRFKTLFW